MKPQWIALLMLPALALPALSDPETFDFKDPKSVNNISFKLDAPLEAVSGNAAGITGTVAFDPQNPGAASGKIVVTAISLTTANSMQTGHLHGKDWLDVASHPEITFQSKELKNVKTEGDKTTADVAGTFTLHGVTRDLTLPVEFTYLKDKLGNRVPGQKGDLLVIRSNFSIKRTDYGINPGKFEEEVSDTINLTLTIAGAAAK